MTPEIGIRPLPGPFAPADEQVTVATPSCCCCCCCLVSLVTATTVTAAEANLQAKKHGGNRWLATTIGLVAVPAGLGVALLSVGLGAAAIVTGMVATALVIWGSLEIAREPRAYSLPFVIVVPLGLTAAFIIEIFAALATVFIIELFAPLGIWLGITIARMRADSPRPMSFSPVPPPTSTVRPPLPPPRPLELDHLPPPGPQPGANEADSSHGSRDGGELDDDPPPIP